MTEGERDCDWLSPAFRAAVLRGAGLHRSLGVEPALSPGHTQSYLSFSQREHSGWTSSHFFLSARHVKQPALERFCFF